MHSLRSCNQSSFGGRSGHGSSAWNWGGRWGGRWGGGWGSSWSYVSRCGHGHRCGQRLLLQLLRLLRCWSGARAWHRLRGLVGRLACWWHLLLVYRLLLLLLLLRRRRLLLVHRLLLLLLICWLLLLLLICWLLLLLLLLLICWLLRWRRTICRLLLLAISWSTCWTHLRPLLLLWGLLVLRLILLLLALWLLLVRGGCGGNAIWALLLLWRGGTAVCGTPSRVGRLRLLWWWRHLRLLLIIGLWR